MVFFIFMLCLKIIFSLFVIILDEGNHVEKKAHWSSFSKTGFVEVKDLLLLNPVFWWVEISEDIGTGRQGHTECGWLSQDKAV